MQQRWLTKLLGYDFLVKYKQSKDNVVVDAFSRRHEEEEAVDSTLTMISVPQPKWLQKLKQLYKEDQELQRLMQK